MSTQLVNVALSVQYLHFLLGQILLPLCLSDCCLVFLPMSLPSLPALIAEEPLVSAVPIGLNFHTLQGGRTDGGATYYGEPKMSSAEQFGVLCAVRSAAVPMALRRHATRILAPFRLSAEPDR